MEAGRETGKEAGREGGREKGSGGREGGALAKPLNQLCLIYIRHSWRGRYNRQCRRVWSVELSRLRCVSITIYSSCFF